MGIAPSGLDFYDDASGDLMAKLSAPAEVLKTELDVLSEEVRARLDDYAFALVTITKQGSVKRSFPVNDPGNAWLSAQYFEANHEKLAVPARLTAARFIKDACSAYGVPSSPLVDAYAKSASAQDASSNTFVEGSERDWILERLAERELFAKQASAAEMNALLELPDHHFALMVHTGDGEVIRKYAMPDVESVKTAAAYFDRYAMDLAAEHRHRFASSVKNRAGELGVDLRDTRAIDKWASPDWNVYFPAYLEQRKSLLPRAPDARDVLDKLAQLVGETEPAAMAQALRTFDEATGLDRYYDRGLPDAYASTFGKQASAWSAEVDGHSLTEADLKRVAQDGQLKRYLGTAFAAEFAKSPVEIFDSLPEPEKVLVKQIATGEA